MRYGLLQDHHSTQPRPALLYIPGLGGSVKIALPFLQSLLPYFNPIYGVDLRGFGLNISDEPLQDVNHLLPDMEAFDEQVLAPARQSGEFNAGLSLAAISLGGVVATLLASRHPERYQELLLFAPAYAPHPTTFPASYLFSNLLNHIFKGRHARTRLPYDISKVTRNPLILADPDFQSWLPRLTLTPGFLLSVRLLSLRAMLACRNITVPTCMFIPGADEVCDPATMLKAFHRIPRQTPKHVITYPNFYHDLLLEESHHIHTIVSDLLAWRGKRHPQEASLVEAR